MPWGEVLSSRISHVDPVILVHEKLKESIDSAHKVALKKCRRQKKAHLVGGRGRRRGRRIPPPNGKIDTSVRLACALRYFAGGLPYDIMVQYGVSHTEMLDSVWYVVEASNKIEGWFIAYPDDHDVQRRMAAEFKQKSAVDFDMCSGTIDGILIWIHKPTLEEAKEVGVDQQKFFCGRKHKFGLNCQAVCDSRGRFIDISITYGGSSSDLLAFENSELFKHLEGGVLAQGLVLFGDNAYLNTPYMATPYRNTSSGA